MAKDNGDAKDVKENSSWRCPVCKMSGKCVKGDEGMALALHMAVAHPKKK